MRKAKIKKAKHECSFGYLDKSLENKLVKIIDSNMLFLKCRCGEVRPFKLEDFRKNCTNGKLVKIKQTLGRKGLHLSIPE